MPRHQHARYLDMREQGPEGERLDLETLSNESDPRPRLSLEAAPPQRTSELETLLMASDEELQHERNSQRY